MTPEGMEIHDSLAKTNGSPLELEIHLLDVKPPNSFTKDAWEMTFEEKYSELPATKDQGAEFFKSGDYNSAKSKYERCLVLIEALNRSDAVMDLSRNTKNGDAQNDAVDIRLLTELEQSCRLNYAACCLKLLDFKSVIEQCTSVLKTNSKCTKALFRRGKAYSSIGRDLDLASKDFELLQKLIEPHTPEWDQLMQEQSKLKIKLIECHRKEKVMFAGKMFQ